MNIQYPDVLYMSDTIANVKLTIPQSVRNKKIQKEGFKCPDLLILEPKGKYHGLFIELKVKNIYKKNGELLKNDHLDGQAKTISDLKDKGYYATFSIGFENTKQIIDWYMGL